MDVSIIIINYNTFNLIVDCIVSIYSKTSGVSYEIIVVDNNSPNRDIEGLTLIFPKIRLILNSTNAGFGAGNNLGSKSALGKYLLFLNSDTLLLNNAINEFYLYMDKHPEVGICGGNLYQKNGRPGVSFERRLPGIIRDVDNLFFMLFSKAQFGNNLIHNFEDHALNINGYVSGADLCIPKDFFFELGGFDEDFFMYYEETELTHRVLKNKREVHVIPQSKIIHLEGGSQEGVSALKLGWMKESKALYFEKTNTRGLWWSDILNQLIGLRDRFIQKIKS